MHRLILPFILSLSLLMSHTASEPQLFSNQLEAKSWSIKKKPGVKKYYAKKVHFVKKKTSAKPA